MFITIAALMVHRLGGATYTCLIAGFLDSLYTGLPIAIILFAIRGVTFDLALYASKAWSNPSLIKVVLSSSLSSLITGLTAYITIVEMLGIMEAPLEVFMFFIAVSTILSGAGSGMGLKLWQKLPMRAT